MFGSVFRFSHLKTAVFRVFHGLRVFSNLVFGFRFSSTIRTLSSGNADSDGDAETCEKIGERTPL